MKKYRAAVISLGSESSLRTIEAMQNYFDVVDNIQIKNVEVVLGDKQGAPLYEGKPLPEYDCVFIKGSYKYAAVAKSVASMLEGSCYQAFKPASFTTVHNKLLTHLELQKHNIPMPVTYLSATMEAGKQLLKRITYPIIVKLPEGTQGVGVMFADSYAAASSLLDTLQTLKQPFLIQEYVETGGQDVRAIVVGNKVVGAMKRKASVGEVRSNTHQGGSVESYKLSDKEEKLCLKIARALDADICGVDLLQGPKGSVCIEANISPGLQGIMSATKKDIPDIIAQFLFKQTEQFLKLKAEGLPSNKKILGSLGISSVDPKTSNQDIISHLDLRGSRVLLPEVVTKLANIDEQTEYIINAKAGKIEIKKF